MSRVRKRSVTIGGHRTSYSIEDEFHTELTELAMKRGIALAVLVAEIDATRPAGTNLSSALRLFVLGSLKSGIGSQS
ncbi:MAG: ribbon-helix-helix domain-containing protein [Rhizobiaceae bacterium]|nr:ribbon-helix-helix domain-containing protein [Rhizobiaceae bacterium]